MFFRSNYKLFAGIALILLPLVFIYLILPSKLSQHALGQQRSELQSLGDLLHHSIEEDLHAYGRFATNLARHPEIIAAADSSIGYTVSKRDNSAQAPNKPNLRSPIGYQQANQSLIELFNSLRNLEPFLDTVLLANTYGRPWLELAVRKGITPPSSESLFSETKTGFHISTMASGRISGLWVASKINQSSTTAQSNYILLRFEPEALKSAASAAKTLLGDRAVYIKTKIDSTPNASVFSPLYGHTEKHSLDSIDQYLQAPQQFSGTKAADLRNIERSTFSIEEDQLTFLQTLNPVATDLLVLDSWSNSAGSKILGASETIRSYAFAATLLACVFAILLVATIVRSSHIRQMRILEGISQLLKRDYSYRVNDSTSDLVGSMARQLDSLSKEFSEEFTVGLAVYETVKFNQSHDQITQLPNRDSVLKCLADLENNRQMEGLTLFMFELSDIESTRKTYGNEAIHHILQTITERMHEQLPVATMIGQWKEGTYVVLQKDDQDNHFNRSLPAAMQTLTADVHYEGNVIQLDFNHGIARTNKNTQPHIIIAEARAMIADQARLRSHDGIRIIESVNTVEETVASDRLSVVYQPVMSLDKTELSTMTQAEVTVRLHKGDGDIHPTAEILYDIQDSPAGLTLDSEVLVSALNEMRAWHEKDLLPTNFKLSFNLTRFSVKTQGILKLVRKQVIDGCVKPEHLMFEIAPMALLQNSDTINAMRSMGICIAVDDIATEELSINQLQTMRPDFMKMDIKNLEQAVLSNDRLAKAQLRTRLAYFRSLGISIIVKNIESTAQQELAKEFGVKLIQGHLIARPCNGQQFILARGEQQSIDKAA